MNIAFQLDHVTKRYRIGEDEISVLKDINLEIPMGQFVSIIGPSGSGKSTMMHLLGCLDDPTEGELSIMGQGVHGLSDDELAALRCEHLGFIFQAFHLLPSYDALANVAVSMVYSGHPDRWGRAKELLEILGLGHRLHHRPQALSGGEKQRVAIARALANDPQIILADEPTGALDQANGRAILELLEELHRNGKTVVLVTHDMNVAHHAERIVEMVDGEINKDQLLRPSSSWNG